jgi:hypothetical protein
MSWDISLKNLELIFPSPSIGSTLTYHLHAGWPLDEAYSTDQCGLTGGHYDPFFGCGPASGQQGEDGNCEALDREGSNYMCPGAYDEQEYDKCEVGDLAGKYGGLTINKNDKVRKSVKDDPFPAMYYHYYDGDASAIDTDPFQFASIVFHRAGGARVLCGKLVKVE